MQDQAKTIMISRICGIVSGVCLTLFFAVTILPATAHGEMISGITLALRRLLELDQLSWLHCGGTPPAILLSPDNSQTSTELAEDTIVKVRSKLHTVKWTSLQGSQGDTPARQDKVLTDTGAQ